jgi:hypothetical protein
MASTAARPSVARVGGDQAEVGADVVGPLQQRSGLAAAGVDLGQGVQDGGGADPQPQAAGAGADQVAGLQRGRLGEQGDQPGQLAALGAGPFRRGDLVQAVEHHPDLQGCRPRPGGGLQQPLGAQAQVADLPRGGQHLLGGDLGGGGDRPGGQPLVQAELHPGEVGRDLALAQQRHGGQQPLGGLPHQLGQPADQLQPGGGTLQVPVGLGDDLVAHPPSSAPTAQPAPADGRARRISARS